MVSLVFHLRRWLKFLQNGAAFTRKATMEWGTTIVKRKEVPMGTVAQRDTDMFAAWLAVADTVRSCVPGSSKVKGTRYALCECLALFQLGFDHGSRQMLVRYLNHSKR